MKRRGAALKRRRRRSRADPGCLMQLFALMGMVYVWLQARRWDRRHNRPDIEHDP